MENLANLGQSLEKSLANEKLKEMIADLGDVTLEQLSKTSESVPILSILFKSYNTFTSIRDYFFTEKLIKYLTEIATIPLDQRRKTIERIAADKKYGVKFGQKLLTTIDRLDDEIKAYYLAKAYKYLANEEISLEFYIRLGTIIDGLLLSNIETLEQDLISLSSDPTNKNLERLGLANMNLKIRDIKNPGNAINAEKYSVNFLNGYTFTFTGRVVNNIFIGKPIYYKSRYDSAESFNSNVHY